jgi:hypothetical protein
MPNEYNRTPASEIVVGGREMLDPKVMRRIFVNLLLVLAALAVGAALIEVGTRLVIGLPKPYPLKPNSYVFDRRGFWTVRPGLNDAFDNDVDFRNAAVNVGPLGARRTACTENGSAPAVRLFLIGDSQTFGWGLADAETWASGLQCALSKARPGAFRVYNFGVPGTQVDQYWSRAAAQVAPAVRPGDVVVVSVTWNDLVTFYAGKAFVDRAVADAASVTGAAGGLELQLAEPLRYLDPPTWRYRVYEDYGLFVPSIESAKAFGESMVHVSAAFGLLWNRARLLYYRLRPADSFAKKVDADAFEHNFRTLKAIAAVLERRGARVIVQLLPNRLFFDDFYYASYSKNGVAFPARDYMGHIAEPYCRDLDLACVNRFADLLTAQRDAHTFAVDGHYNAAGAARVAAALGQDVLMAAPK